MNGREWGDVIAARTLKGTNEQRMNDDDLRTHVRASSHHWVGIDVAGLLNGAVRAMHLQSHRDQPTDHVHGEDGYPRALTDLEQWDRQYIGRSNEHV